MPSKIKHTFISWDCSFRNFFHLIDALLIQDYSKDEIELIYVEQRSRKFADAFNHKQGFKSLGDRYDDLKDKFNFKVIYMNQPESIPYNLSMSNNKGIQNAKGEYIHVLDGDQLLPKDFINRLDKYHDGKKTVLNLYRKMCEYPVGVFSFKKWFKGSRDFDKCHLASVDRFVPIKKVVNNYGPMISSHKDNWLTIEGYDENVIWSSVLSTAGADVNHRLEVLVGSKSKYLPATFSIHPWHPKGGGLLRKESDSRKFFSLQNELTQFSIDKNKAKVSQRKKLFHKIYSDNKSFIDDMASISDGSQEDLNKYIFLRRYIKVKSIQYYKLLKGK